MFYTLASRLPYIVNDNSNSKFLKIFILGSVLYVLLHYYLFSANRGDMMNMVKQYLYYAMVADLGIAYALIKLFGGTSEQVNKNEYSKDEMEEIQKQMQLARARAYQEEIIKRQLIEQKKENEQKQDNEKDDEKDDDAEEYSNKSPFKKKGKNNTSSSSSSSSEKEKEKDKKRIKNKKTSDQKEESDTHLPIYNDE